MFLRVCHLVCSLLLLRPTFGARAQYAGEFSYVKSRFCQGPGPLLFAQCAEEIEILGVSDPLILCTVQREAWDEGFRSAVACEVDCHLDDGGCNDIFHETEPDPVDSIFARIEFACTGTDSVDARFSYEDSGDGSCRAGAFNPYNLHQSRLGVYSNELKDYDFGGNLVELDHYPTNDVTGAFGPHDAFASIQPLVSYTGLSGSACFSCSTEFDRIVLDVDEHRLILADHVTTTGGESYVTPPAPAPAPSPPGTYNVEFNGGWSLGALSYNFCEYDSTPVATFTCTNGGTISLLSRSSNTISCQSRGSSSLRCVDTEPDNYESFIRDFEYTSIRFQCTGPSLPEARAEISSLTWTCLAPYQGVSRVRLGLVCDSYETFGDIYFECDNDSLFFTPRDEVDGVVQEEGTYICTQPSNHPGDGERSKDTVGPAVIFTDWRYSWNIPRECYSGPALTAPSSPAQSPSPSPTPPPPTPFPIPSPTPSPPTPFPTPSPTPSPPTPNGLPDSAEPTASPTDIQSTPLPTPFTCREEGLIFTAQIVCNDVCGGLKFAAQLIGTCTFFADNQALALGCPEENALYGFSCPGDYDDIKEAIEDGNLDIMCELYCSGWGADPAPAPVNNPSPGPSPSVPPPTPNPGPSTCDAESAAIGTCGSATVVSDCDTCVAAGLEALPGGASTCAGAEAQVCNVLESCDSICGTCEDEFEDLLDCVWRNTEGAAAAGCGGLDCGSSSPPPTRFPTPSAPPPTPSPGPSTCDAEQSAAQTCAASSTVSACIQCVNAATGDLEPQSTCAAAEAEICRAINSCDSICDTCEDEIEDFFDCAWRNNEDAVAAGCGGLMSCGPSPTPFPTPSPTPSPPTPDGLPDSAEPTASPTGPGPTPFPTPGNGPAPFSSPTDAPTPTAAAPKATFLAGLVIGLAGWVLA